MRVMTREEMHKAWQNAMDRYKALAAADVKLAGHSMADSRLDDALYYAMNLVEMMAKTIAFREAIHMLDLSGEEVDHE